MVTYMALFCTAVLFIVVWIQDLFSKKEDPDDEPETDASLEEGPEEDDDE